jgi:TetR/AcrR family transcriptional repressor of nem operon
MLQRGSVDTPPVDALQRFFEGSFTAPHGAGAARGHWGCMLVNTVLEMAGVDDALAARASDHLGEVQRYFRAHLADAGAAPDQAAERAAMLLLIMEGVRVSSRRRLPGAQHLQPIATACRLVRSALA